MEKNIKNNSGYTLVEMIIVIAIIAILSGAAMMSIASINSSRALTAMEQFDNEISSLVTRTKTQNKDNALKIVKSGNDYKIFYGTYDGTTFTENNAGKADVTLSRVSITFSATYDGDATDDADGTVIQISKSDGRVKYGYGTYIFRRYNNQNPVGRVIFNEHSGGHTIGN